MYFMGIMDMENIEIERYHDSRFDDDIYDTTMLGHTRWM